jgi:hypothetical protein
LSTTIRQGISIIAAALEKKRRAGRSVPPSRQSASAQASSAATVMPWPEVVVAAGDRRPDGIHVADVGGAAIGRAHPVQSGDGGFDLLRVARDDEHRGSGASKGLGDAEVDAAGPARNEYRFAFVVGRHPRRLLLAGNHRPCIQNGHDCMGNPALPRSRAARARVRVVAR